jgi:hypothetical protein
LFVKQHHRGERAMARELRNVLMDIGEEVVQNIQAAAARNEPITSTTVLSLQSDAWEDRIKTVAYEHLSRMAVNGALLEWQLFVPRFRDTGKVVVKALPGTLANMAQELPDSVREAIGQFTDNLLQQPYWKDLTENVRADLAESIRKGVEAGDSGADIAQRVKTVLGPTGSSTRAYRIARTEVTGALNAGSAVTRTELAEAGLLTGKRWLSISDGSTRAEHKHANGQRVQPDEDFTVGGEKCSYPGDVKLSAKQRCNCRCTTVSVSALDD